MVENQERTYQLELEGFSLFVREAGDPAAPAVLCLHGGPGLDGGYFFPDPARWGPGLRELAEEFRVITYDQRGCGRSGAPDVEQPLALSRHVDDIEAVRAALGLERPILLAHSFGTVLGILYALRHPSNLSGMILIGGAPTRAFMEAYRQAVGEHLPPDAQAHLAELGSRELTDAAFRERFRTALPLYFHRHLTADDRDAFVDGISFNALVNRALAAGLADYDLTPALPNVRAPALIIYGASDRVVQPRYTLEFRGNLLTARFVAFQESGHFPFIEEADAFAQVARYFIRSTLQPSSGAGT